MLKIYNTLTGKKEPFEPLVPKTVRMYVCGVTVYDYCHIGHARSALVFDVIRRYLEYAGYTVEFVKNFTDVDDKIIKRANEEGVSCEAITTKYIDAYYEDMGKLSVRPAWREPKATDSMADIIALIDKLMNKGMAYQVDGDVYFQVERYPDYGRLSKRKLEDLQAGARVEVDERKRHPMDFALWKSSKPGEPSWESPWGPGRPGWHIECSAMSIKHLGETFDIHGGGMDLIFPHHENEIAQSCGATGKEFARYWIHNGFVQINQEKMSKSLGNFFTIREIFFSDQGLNESKQALDGFYDLFNRLAEPDGRSSADPSLEEAVEQTRAMFQQAMDNDLNTPAAVAQLQKLRGQVNKLLQQGLSTHARQRARQAFRSVGTVLELFQLDKWQFGDKAVPLKGEQITAMAGQLTPSNHMSDEQIKAKIAERAEAKKRRDFKVADAIRVELASEGVTIEDKPDGTSRWKR
ncbi:MAG: cysteine--tRNA ligase [Nitrospirae bacterium]|nr:cysteine--tRNA ligase [Nitrospirota bacterium]